MFVKHEIKVCRTIEKRNLIDKKIYNIFQLKAKDTKNKNKLKIIKESKIGRHQINLNYNACAH